jgi:hypothetical protein
LLDWFSRQNPGTVKLSLIDAGRVILGQLAADQLAPLAGVYWE